MLSLSSRLQDQSLPLELDHPRTRSCGPIIRRKRFGHADEAPSEGLEATGGLDRWHEQGQGDDVRSLQLVGQEVVAVEGRREMAPRPRRLQELPPIPGQELS